MEKKLNFAHLLDAILNAVQDQPFIASFIISLVSNSIPYMAVPYLIIIAVFAGHVNGLWGKALLILGGGVGAAIGKLIVYMLGRGVHMLLSQDTKENLDVFVRLFEKSMFIAILLFATLPLPDDLLYIPLGVAGYSIKLYFLAVVIGKTILTSIVVVFGSAITELMAEFGAEGATASMLSTLTIILISIVVSIIIVRMDWRKIAQAYSEKGVIYGTCLLIVEGVKALHPRYKRSRTSAQKQNKI